MELQIGEGLYNNDREKGDSWASQTFWVSAHPSRINIFNELKLKMIIQDKDMLPKWGQTDFPWLNRAAAAEETRKMVTDYFIAAMPEDRIKFYPKDNLVTARTRIRRNGFLEIHFVWNSVDLKQNPDGSGQKTDDELENTRIKFIKFMSEIKRTFHTGFMYSIGDKVRDQLVKKAKKMENKWDQDNQNLDEESQAILKELIKESRK
jgi:hypothetical protein